jgi:dienelactone hydrolase
MADESAFDQSTWAYAKKLRDGDNPPASREDWDKRRKTLREKLLAAMGPRPEKACELEPQVLGTLDRDGFKIEKLVFQSRPDVWVTANAYVPSLKEGQKTPAVLVVHGHWAGARRDPVVQARCLGLVKLGFFVLSVDAFGSGERYTNPARGTYHGALYGATLWPTGHTLLGMQVYDNHRAVDYLLTRKEVSGKIGITGASGGGNQSMNAGAMDDRIQAVVPVCSVGNYQAYLHAACCVCEVLPGALKFTEEGDVLGLVAPRGLLVMNASRDGIQFSPPEAEKSLARAKDIFKVMGVEANVKHVVFESGHDYNKAMREMMYGWMTLHLKGEGKGEPISEPEHKIESLEDLACYSNPNDRPKGFLTPPLFAGKVGREMVAMIEKLVPDHTEMWEATGIGMRAVLKSILGPMPRTEKPKLTVGDFGESGKAAWVVHGEGGLILRGSLQNGAKGKANSARRCLVLHLEGDEAARAHPTVKALLDDGFQVLTVDLRGTGNAKPKNGAIAGAPDHTAAEHGLWCGRPLLGQWVTDTLTIFQALQVDPDAKESLVCIGQAGIVGLAVAAMSSQQPASILVADLPVSFVTDAPYGNGTYMGLLAPGILKVGDIPHLAGMAAPRRLIIAGGVSPQGKKLSQKELDAAFAFTTEVFKATKARGMLTLDAEPNWNRIDL